MPQEKQPFITEVIPRKEYNYSLGDMKLSFTIRMDMKEGIEDFKTLLEHALKDVNADLDTMQ